MPAAAFDLGWRGGGAHVYVPPNEAQVPRVDGCARYRTAHENTTRTNNARFLFEPRDAF